MSSETATAADKQKLKEMIVKFYAVANNKPPIGLKITDRTAEVFMKMLSEADKCTKTVAYVPLPLGSKTASGNGLIVWVATHVWGMFFDSFSEKLNSVCVTNVLSRWGTEMDMANLGL
ncbi:MAG: hypothetical protein L3J84_06600 [Gammaproteobacteria bacterium]|nr:hypothetical protein [Gammaproteobacteria bacterium]